MHAGDIFARKDIPILDANNGGSGVAYPETLAKVGQGRQQRGSIIPGHSTLMTPADLTEFAEFVKDFVAWTESEMKAGKSADAAAAEYKVPERTRDTLREPASRPTSS